MMPPSIRFHSSLDHTGIRLVSGSHLRRHTFPYHVHKSYSLGMVFKGQRLLYVEGNAYQLSAGDCFIINPYQAHACCIQRQQAHDYAVLSIEPDYMQQLMRKVIGYDKMPYFSPMRLDDESFRNWMLAWKKDGEDPAKNWGELADVLCNMIFQRTDLSGIPQTPAERSPMVDVTCRKLEEHNAIDIHLDDIAGRLRVSPYYLNRRFRQEIGVPPHSYLLQFCINKSLLLLSKEPNISEIALSLGFCDQSHFTRLFKRRVGITPARYLALNEGTSRR